MKVLSIGIIALIITITSTAQIVKFNSVNGIAIKGYDPVAYFLQHTAVEGSHGFTADWSGSKWKFISQANLDSFKISPEKYAPQFGGYCAYGCSEGHKSPTDPNAWTVTGNKLYLNYNLKVKELWIKDTANRIKAANEYWLKQAQ
ncbi:YHS domain-containing (seleno)protein [Ferruginibacter sp.]|nr:YHS domain protein [Ferruginibacter sp.]